MVRHVLSNGRSPLQKRYLVPLWLIRDTCMVLSMIASSLMMADILRFAVGRGGRNRYIDFSNLRFYDNDYSVAVLLAMLCVMTVLVLVCGLLDVVCMFKFWRKTLAPRFFLVINGLQTAAWTVVFVMAIIGHRTRFSLAVNSIVFICSVGLLGYASWMFHKHRTGLGNVEKHNNNTVQDQWPGNNAPYQYR